MFKSSIPVISIPLVVLNSDVSDKDLLTLFTFSAVTSSGKAAWEEVAALRGYASVGYLKSSLERLEESGHIRIDGWEVDVTPLVESCRGNRKLSGQIVQGETKPKQKKEKKHYLLYPRIKDVVPIDSKHKWASVAKLIMDQEAATLNDLEACVRYMDSYYGAMYGKYEHRKRVNPHTLRENYDKWVEGGKKKAYKGADTKGSLKKMEEML